MKKKNVTTYPIIKAIFLDQSKLLLIQKKRKQKRRKQKKEGRGGGKKEQEKTKVRIFSKKRKMMREIK